MDDAQVNGRVGIDAGNEVSCTPFHAAEIEYESDNTGCQLLSESI